MPRRTDIFAVLIAAAAASLAGCATPPLRSTAQEYPEVLRNCELPEAEWMVVSGRGTHTMLLLPPSLYARREEAPVRGRIACVEHWGRERGVAIEIRERAR